MKLFAVVAFFAIFAISSSPVTSQDIVATAQDTFFRAAESAYIVVDYFTNYSLNDVVIALTALSPSLQAVQDFLQSVLPYIVGPFYGLDVQGLLDVVIDLFAQAVLDVRTATRSVSAAAKKAGSAASTPPAGDNYQLANQGKSLFQSLANGGTALVTDFVNDQPLLVNSDFKVLLVYLRNVRDFFKSAESPSVVNNTDANTLFRKFVSSLNEGIKAVQSVVANPAKPT